MRSNPKTLLQIAQHTSPVAKRVGLGAMLCLFTALSTPGAIAQQTTAAKQAVKTIKHGETLSIFLPPQLLAEANKPTVELADGSALWIPGPELFYGHAVRDLRDYLQKMTGAQYPLASTIATAKAGIFAGTFAQHPNFKPQQATAKQAIASTDPEAFIIEVQGGKLFILGRSNLGLMAGIYTLLDKLGCRWYAPGQEWENVPSLNGLVLDAKLNMAVAGPSYKSRLFFPSYGPNTSLVDKGARETDYTLWNLRNRMGGSAYTANAHNPHVISPALFETRPELFAKITQGPWAAYTKNGRLNREVARCNPEVVALSVETAVKYLKENEGKGSYYNSFSVETDDGIPADEDCVAQHGNATNLDFWFANQVAAGIEKAGLNDKWVGILSYSDHSDIPAFDLHPKVAVTVASALVDPKLTTEQRLAGFRQRKAQRIGIYDYPSIVIWSKERPGRQVAGKPLDFAANLKRWHQHGANGYIAETSDTWINSGPGHYLAARVLWDAGINAERELEAYYAGAFGPAAKEVRQLYEDFGTAPQLTRGRLAQWYHWITTADQKLSGGPNYKRRINDIKRYYLFTNLLREYEMDLQHPKVPSKVERYNRILRYVAANRGEGAFHALGLLITFLYEIQYTPGSLIKLEQLDEPFQAIAKYNYDEAAWMKFPHLSDAQIDQMFAAVKLPLNGQSTDAGVLDPAIKVFPANATPPTEIKFPLLHGIPGGNPRQYILKVIAPTPKLTFNIIASNPHGAGDAERTMTLTDENGNEIKSLKYKIGEPVAFEITNVKPGVYTAAFANFGAEQLTVRGGNTFGAVRGYKDTWGFNPVRTDTEKDRRVYFMVPAGASTLSAGLLHGVVSLGFKDGEIIAAEVKGSPEIQKQPQEWKFAPSDKPRQAYVQWSEVGNIPSSQGFVIEGVTLYSPDSSYVLYESLD